MLQVNQAREPEEVAGIPGQGSGAGYRGRTSGRWKALDFFLKVKKGPAFRQGSRTGYQSGKSVGSFFLPCFRRIAGSLESVQPFPSEQRAGDRNNRKGHQGHREADRGSRTNTRAGLPEGKQEGAGSFFLPGPPVGKRRPCF